MSSAAAAAPAAPASAWHAPRLALLVVPLLLVVLLAGAAFFWVQAKHQRADKQLQDIAPRYARLLGMQAQQDEIRQALHRLADLKAEYVYPQETDASQTGNGVQQRLRDALTRAGLSVLSSQVRVVGANDPQGRTRQGSPPQDAPLPYQRIDIIMSVSGNWQAVQTGLLAAAGLRPGIWLDDVHITLIGNLQNNSRRNSNNRNRDQEVAERLQVQLVFHILRSDAP